MTDVAGTLDLKGQVRLQQVSRAGAVADVLRDAILRGDLPPGTPLVERELAERLQMSKTPVREALIALAARGLVRSSEHRIMTVVTVDAETVQSVYELRAILEPHAIASLEGIPVPALIDAQRLLTEASEAPGDEDWVRLSTLNRQFHRLMYAGCRNRLIVETLDGLQDQVRLIATSGWRRHPDWAIEEQEHNAILHAAQAGNVEQAGKLMREHIEGSLARIHAHIDGAPGMETHG